MRLAIILLSVCCLAVFIGDAVGLQASNITTTFEPQFRPTLRVERTAGDIKIDGDLDDAGWVSADRVNGFVERYPGDNTQPEVNTEVMLAYDDEHIYVAYLCHDDPGMLRATMSQRDQYSGDDAVSLLIDTYGQAAWAYEFFVNPYGVQKDCLWSNVGGEDYGFDLIWESAATVTESGYQVEMAIPFTSLRFPNRDVQSWRIDFWRIRPRESYHQYSWAAYDRNERCFPCQWGTVEGIADVQPGKGLEILPSMVGNQSGALADGGDPNSGFDNEDADAEFSVGTKYSIASDMTLEATYNPDFSQIEADAAQVDVNTTIALFYPERRPFFQEGADVFRTLFNSFYTRTVNDPQYAVKMVSRKPGFTFGLMSAADENTAYIVPLEESSSMLLPGKSYVNVLRGSRSIAEGSQLGFIVTDRRFEAGGYGTIVGIDGDIRLTPSIGIDGQFLTSFTGEPVEAGASASLAGVPIGGTDHTALFDGESFQGNAFIARLKRFARHWSFLLDYNQVDPSYRTQTGYDPWINYRNGSIWSQYRLYPEGGPFQRLQTEIYLDGRWLFDGTRRWEHQTVSVYGQLRWAQTGISLAGRRGSETWTSYWTGERIEYDDLLYFDLDVNCRPSDKIGVFASVELGRTVARFADAVGNERSVDFTLDLKPIDRFTIEPNFNWVKSTEIETGDHLFRQYIARTRFQLQVNRQASVRLVVQYNDSKSPMPWLTGKAWDIDPLITYRLSPFTVLYLGSTHDYSYFDADEPGPSRWKLSSRQFFMKLQYLFQM